jgi:hypothetical protein
MGLLWRTLIGSTYVDYETASAKQQCDSPNHITCIAVREILDHEGNGEVEAVMADSGGEPGGVALGIGEGAGQCGEPAQQFVAADPCGCRSVS